ncbi:unnamed protein product [Musa acuminata subsp. malaccensis]|uniref:(wild Malaysian banana) hypothetical protein n=1 Tax=Musa acuminata subsp. malaccensis TaxID=214687 RepID=A0A804LAX3_MUSAM|nr:unnamed protein product [Musa acuminata subsp. malaccensis]
MFIMHVNSTKEEEEEEDDDGTILSTIVSLLLACVRHAKHLLVGERVGVDCVRSQREE